MECKVLKYDKVSIKHRPYTKNAFEKRRLCSICEIVWLFNPYSAGIDFSRQNLTSVDVRFWRLKSITALQE